MAAGVLLILVGFWLLMQTLIGKLPDRLISWAGVGPKEAGGLKRDDYVTPEGDVDVDKFLDDWRSL